MPYLQSVKTSCHPQDNILDFNRLIDSGEEIISMDSSGWASYNDSSNLPLE